MIIVTGLSGCTPLRLWAVIKITNDLAIFHFDLAGLVVILFKLACGTLEIALFETILMLLQGIVQYHLPPPSAGACEGINAASLSACLC